MERKRELVDYLLGVIQFLERERGRRVTYTEFADIVDLPIKTVTVMFDPNDPRVPSRRNAQSIAIGLNSNKINQILDYPSVDQQYIDFMRTYRALKPEQRAIIIRQMKNLSESSLEAAPA